jgi:hypothetical protein
LAIEGNRSVRSVSAAFLQVLQASKFGSLHVESWVPFCRHKEALQGIPNNTLRLPLKIVSYHETEHLEDELGLLLHKERKKWKKEINQAKIRMEAKILLNLSQKTYQS